LQHFLIFPTEKKQAKVLSKKEKKAKEDAELEQLLAGIETTQLTK